jgi:hypothetical protein
MSKKLKNEDCRRIPATLLPNSIQKVSRISNKKLNSAYPNEEKRSLSDGHKMELSVKWEIPQAMNAMLFNFDHYRKRD